MRFIFAIFVVWFAICLIPDPRVEVRAAQQLPYDSVDCDNADGNPLLCTVEPDESNIIEEKVWLSRTCPGSHWYLADSDESSVTVHCDPQNVEDGN